jgi:uncharacterized protein YuzE
MKEGRAPMSKEPHAGGILDKYPYVDKRDVVGRVVCILDARSENRGMELSIHPSRAMDKVAYIGFFEVKEGGIILVNDRVRVEGQEVGQVVGFDFTHAPNHLNILIRVGLKLGGRVVFSMPVQREDI